MFETADGTRLELAPWRQRRLVAQLARARGYPPGKVPHTVVMDLHNLIRRARVVRGPTRQGLARLRTQDACCQACLLARQRRDVLDLVGLVITQSVPATGDGWLGVLLGELQETGLQAETGSELEFENELEASFAHTALRAELEGEVNPSGQYTLNWLAAPVPLASAAQSAKGGGLYMLVDVAGNGKRLPRYIGSANSLPARLKKYQWYASVLGTNNPPLVTYAALSGATPARILSAERALIRIYHNANIPLRNTLLRTPVTVGSTALQVVNVVPPGVSPSGNLPGSFSKVAGGSFELEAEFEAELAGLGYGR